MRGLSSVVIGVLLLAAGSHAEAQGRGQARRGVKPAAQTEGGPPYGYEANMPNRNIGANLAALRSRGLIPYRLEQHTDFMSRQSSVARLNQGGVFEVVTAKMKRDMRGHIRREVSRTLATAGVPLRSGGTLPTGTRLSVREFQRWNDGTMRAVARITTGGQTIAKTFVFQVGVAQRGVRGMDAQGIIQPGAEPTRID